MNDLKSGTNNNAIVQVMLIIILCIYLCNITIVGEQDDHQF